MVARRTTIPSVVLVALVLAACGGGDGSTTTGAAKPQVNPATAEAITSASVAIFASANATRNIVGHPDAVASAEQLLKPLAVARTLGVNPSDPSAGGLTQNLLDQLDGTVPGLTRQGANGEQLDAPIVRRFLAYGGRHPTEVFHDKAAAGVRELERLLRGQPRSERVTPQLESAGQLVAGDTQTARAYWPDLAKRLQTLNSSLH